LIALFFFAAIGKQCPSHPFKASKITGEGLISAGMSGYFAWGYSRSEVGEGNRQTRLSIAK